MSEVFSLKNLKNAHHKCRLSKQHKRGTVMFELDLPCKLVKLTNELASFKYKMGGYTKFKVLDPKERNIEALSYADRVVLVCFCENSLKPRLERRLIYDNAASRENKGTQFAIDRLHKFMHDCFTGFKNNKFYFLKCDISKYFANIDHAILLEKLKQIGLSEDELWFCELVIKNGDYARMEKGLPLGNLTSQWFALLYLDEVDRFIKEKLRIKYYTRYMDDFVLIHENKWALRNAKYEISKLCAEKLKLLLSPNKTVIGRVGDGLDYLGFNHKLLENGKIQIKQRQQAKQRMKHKIKRMEQKYNAKQIDVSYLKIREQAYLNHLKFTDEKDWVKKRFNKICKIT